MTIASEKSRTIRQTTHKDVTISKTDVIAFPDYSQYGIGAGDKVAILSQSMPNWSVAFFATVPFGRISIPILPDSSENEVTDIINHSESRVVFVSKRLACKINQEIMGRMTLGMLYPMYTGSAEQSLIRRSRLSFSRQNSLMRSATA